MDEGTVVSNTPPCTHPCHYSSFSFALAKVGCNLSPIVTDTIALRENGETVSEDDSASGFAIITGQ
jgi:hypothetical protein